MKKLLRDAKPAVSNISTRSDTSINDVALLIQKLYHDREFIASALDYAGGTHTFDDVAMMVLRGQLLYWHLNDACILGEVITYPQRKDLHFFLSAGKLEEITAMQSKMVDAAVSLGCSSMSITGRPGWLKPLGKLGWKPHSQTMWFDITDEPNLFTVKEEETICPVAEEKVDQSLPKSNLTPISKGPLSKT
jgi:hypothetical protein